MENPGKFNYRYLGKVQVKGKQQVLGIYEFFDGEGEQAVQLKVATRADFEKGLSEEERKIIDCVIVDTKNLYWDSFIKHVYDTYPIRVTDRHETLNLVALAKQESSNKQRQSDA